MESNTIWKKNLFSDDNISNMKKQADNDFQTTNMIHKIKKIKKNKKKNPNYKNIELLKDVQTESSTHLNPLPYNENMENPNPIEGFTSDAECRKYHDPNHPEYNPDKCDFEGVDYSPKAKSDDPSLVLINFINTSFDRLRKFNFEKAKFLAQIFSVKKDPDNNDILLITKYIEWFESISLACFCVFNWFFVMFYRDESGQKIPAPDISRAKLWTLTQDFPFLIPIELIFSTAMFFPEVMNYFVFSVFPYYTEKVLSSGFCFVLLFIILIFTIQYGPEQIRKLLVDIAKFNTNNNYITILKACAVIAFFSYFSTLFTTFVKNYDVINFYNLSQFIATKLAPNFIWAFFAYLLQFIIHYFISVPFGGIFCAIYIIVYSLFGIFIHSDFSPSKTYDNFFKLINAINNDNERIQNMLGRDSESFYNKCFIVLNKIAVFFYKVIYQLAFLCMFLYSIFDYANNITTRTYMGEAINRAFKNLDSINKTSYGEKFSLLKMCLVLMTGSIIMLLVIFTYISGYEIIKKSMDKVEQVVTQTSPIKTATNTVLSNSQFIPKQKELLEKLSNNQQLESVKNNMFDSVFNKVNNKIPGKYGNIINSATNIAENAKSSFDKAQNAVETINKTVDKAQNAVETINKTANTGAKILNDAQNATNLMTIPVGKNTLDVLGKMGQNK